ncbi:MAG: sigma-54 dependent transcriptional regulator [Spirochaetales bacterium]|jgi:two-component system response regulator AtoC|nr:sigma-54 dependent transcriptional regulator [Spirochaetales bacterium]
MKILIVDDEKNIRDSLGRLLELEGMDAGTAESGEKARELIENQRFDLALVDLRLPGISGQELVEWIHTEGFLLPVIMISAHGEIQDAVRAVRAGAKDFVEKPFDSGELIKKIRKLIDETNICNLTEAQIRKQPEKLRFIGEHPHIRLLREKIRKIASTDSTVLITGESGCGKEVAAREIHDTSARAAEPFVAVNVGAIPENLLESELFGHEKGAFTSADARRVGLFELAGSGTLFLDEIGEMPPVLQVKLLRVLQDRMIRRLGGSRDIPLGARILSATNRDLEARVAQGLFREDLFYRLNVIRLAIPPLRDRKEDIPLLVQTLLPKLCARLNSGPRKLSPGALQKLMRCRFPGNVRELENVLERAVIYAKDGLIREEDIEGRPLPETNETEKSAPEAKPDTKENSFPAAPLLRSSERELIDKTLRETGGNRTRAARILGISRRTIIYKIKEYRLDREQDA